jgi:hypothetical protein
LSCKKLWYVKLAQLKVQLLHEEDKKREKLTGSGRQERRVSVSTEDWARQNLYRYNISFL